MQVWQHNALKQLAELRDALVGAEFAAFDLEFSGLHAESSTTKPCLFDAPALRYEAVRDAVRLFAPLQLGICVFKADQKVDATTSLKATLFSFNILPCDTSKESSFSVQSSCFRFLASYNFDFNSLFARGISIGRDIVQVLLQSKVPLVAHNAFLDVCFLFQAFINTIPNKLSEFKQEFQRNFSSLYDTKLMCSKSDILRGMFTSTCLEKAYSTVNTESAFDMPHISMARSCDRKFVGVEHVHDAGFDAFMTGSLFAKIRFAIADERNEIGKRSFDSWISDGVDWSTRDTSEFNCRVHLARSLRHLNLGGDDLASFCAILCVRIVLEDDAESIQTSHILEAVKFGTKKFVRVLWHNEVTAFVLLDAELEKEAHTIACTINRESKLSGVHFSVYCGETIESESH